MDFDDYIDMDKGNGTPRTALNFLYAYEVLGDYRSLDVLLRVADMCMAAQDERGFWVHGYRMTVNGLVLAMRYAPSGERLVVQTGEWAHLVDLTVPPRVASSRLMPGLTVPGGLRLESDDGLNFSVLVSREPNAVGLERIDVTSPGTEAPIEDLGRIEAWMDRLKLRFDAAGELVPLTGERATGVSAPAAAAPSEPSG